MLIQTCNTCKKEFVKTHNKNRVYKYCSIKCSTSNPEKIENFAIKMKGRTAWNKGMKGRKHWMNISGLNKGIPWNKGKENIYFKGDKNPNWKGGVTPINEAIRHSIKYKEWRIKILKRDHYSCVSCGHKSKGNYKEVIVDHIKPFSLFPKLRFSLKNGRTLCSKCDSILGWKYQKNREFFNLNLPIGTQA